MDVFSKEPVTINIKGTADDVVSVFLQVYLARKKLSNRELEVATELVKNYSIYIKDGVKEPYASTLLFSTDIRKKICKKLSMSSPQLTNILRALSKKDLLATENKDYIINPDLVPREKLVFNFKTVDASKR